MSVNQLTAKDLIKILEQCPDAEIRINSDTIKHIEFTY